jgi:hypothetical protein
VGEKGGGDEVVEAGKPPLLPHRQRHHLLLHFSRWICNYFRKRQKYVTDPKKPPSLKESVFHIAETPKLWEAMVSKNPK